MSLARSTLIACFALIAGSAYAVPPTTAGMKLRFEEKFTAPLSWCSEYCQDQKWRTKYSHSGNTPLSRGLGMTGTESEVYMDPSYLGLGVNPFQIDHGTLSILVEPASARVKSAVGASWPEWQEQRLMPRFTSGALSTEKSHSQLYGYFEARIKVSNVPGAWPAFWLYQDEGDEIDMMEVLGGLPTRLFMSEHWYVDGQKQDQGVTLDTVDLSADFHNYGVLWTADKIVYYLDDVEVGRLPNFLRRPMYLIINIAMDGDWNKKLGYIAAPNSHTKMMIQYVRSYQ